MKKIELVTQVFLNDDWRTKSDPFTQTVNTETEGAYGFTAIPFETTCHYCDRKEAGRVEIYIKSLSSGDTSSRTQGGR